MCRLFGRHSERLSVCGLAALSSHCGAVDTGCVVAVDCSLFVVYPGFESNMLQALKELLGDQITNLVKFWLSRRGADLGIAVVAQKAAEDAQTGLKFSNSD